MARQKCPKHDKYCYDKKTNDYIIHCKDDGEVMRYVGCSLVSEQYEDYDAEYAHIYQCDKCKRIDIV